MTNLNFDYFWRLKSIIDFLQMSVFDLYIGIIF